MALDDPAVLPVPARTLASLRRWPLRGPRARLDVGAADRGPAAIDEFNRGVMLSAVGDDAAAVAAYRRVIAGADGDLAAKAAFNIACLGSPPAVAEAAYRVVIDTGHRDAAPKAAYNLGCLLQEAGDLAGANDAFLRAAESGHVAVAAEAALKLEELRVAAIRRAAAVPELPQRLTRHRRRTDRRLRGHRPKWFAGNRFSGARRARGASY